MACSRIGKWVLGGTLWLAASAPVAAATVTVAWDPNPEPDVTNYNLYLRTQSGSFGAPIPIGNRTTWTFTGLQNNIQYYFAVQAQSAAGLSALSQIGYVTPPLNLPGSEASRSDFSGDRRLDLMWQHSTTGQLAAWHLNAWTVVGSRWLTPNTVAPVWKMSGSGDFNRDGKPDLLWHNQTSGELVYWLMDGAYNYSSGYLAGAVPPVWSIASIRDFNLDGNPDIWWHNQTTGDMAVWYLNGTTFMSANTPTPARVADTNWKLKGTADFTNDGRADALWSNDVTGAIEVWTLNGALGINQAAVTPLTPGAVAPAWKVTAVGDANADGRPDIIWRNGTTGEIVLWAMQGTTLLNSNYLSTPTADVNWKILAPK